MNAQPRKTAVRSRRLHSLSAAESQPAASILELGAISDAASVQRALSVVINAVASGTLDPARARVLLYGLQIAATNAHRMAASAKKNEAAQQVEQAVADAPAVVETATATQQKEESALRPEENDNAMDEPVVIDENEADTVPAADAPSQPHGQEQERTQPTVFNGTTGYSNPNRERLFRIKARSQSSIV